MHLVVGLGNPGKKYENNRHNVGFVAVDQLHRTEPAFSDFKEKFSGVYAKTDDLALLKPMTFMNLSGDSLQPAAAFLKVEPANIIVLHDELDLPFGDVRIKLGGGHAGHNGLRSIITRLGTPDFIRVRIGVGRPPPDFKGDVADFVLQGFDPSERAELPAIIDKAVAATRAILKHGIVAAMGTANVKAKAKPAPKPPAAPKSSGATTPVPPVPLSPVHPVTVTVPVTVTGLPEVGPKKP
ncbi:MAG: Peptidyl-tRNA hydrolase [Myxococcaceae bacterium]|nr:Peptidyl-tRNA hydrolase [Myxococcaceae bacterium]